MEVVKGSLEGKKSEEEICCLHQSEYPTDATAAEGATNAAPTG